MLADRTACLQAGRQAGRDSAAALVGFRLLGLATASPSRLRTESAGHGSGVLIPTQATQVACFRSVDRKIPQTSCGIFLADRTGFEPAIFSVTGRRVNRATPPIPKRLTATA